MPDHHVKGQPAAPTYVQKRGVSLFTLIVQHPVFEANNHKELGFTSLTKKAHFITFLKRGEWSLPRVKIHNRHLKT